MKALCVVRQVPDQEARVKVVNGAVDLEGTTLALDGMDEYGVEQALRLNADTVVLGIGPERVETALRRALAMGANRAVHVVTSDTLDAVSLATAVAAVARQENPDLILTGGQQADSDSQALGAAVAELLDWPQVTWATALSVEGTTATFTHDTDDGKEDGTCALPAVVTTQQGLNEPRYPTLPNIMKAKSKELRKATLADLGVNQPLVRTVSQAPADKPRLNRVLPGDPREAALELVRLLHEEAKVI
ncbi:MAG TPA: electron transfer flavoprotein subunit beta/FixA family protein [Deinococcales bacterium]|nr:electron transfer flavoprotein subunit beta/FixA family protein [Deinococcales bacterium]